MNFLNKKLLNKRTKGYRNCRFSNESTRMFNYSNNNYEENTHGFLFRWERGGPIRKKIGSARFLQCLHLQQRNRLRGSYKINN